MAEPKQQAPDLIEKIASKLIDALGGDPCVIAILLVVLASFALVVYTFKHQERMERLRLKQAADLFKGAKK